MKATARIILIGVISSMLMVSCADKGEKFLGDWVKPAGRYIDQPETHLTITKSKSGKQLILRFNPYVGGLGDVGIGEIDGDVLKVHIGGLTFPAIIDENDVLRIDFGNFRRVKPKGK